MAYESAPDRYLIISDLQIPFEHPKALEFCRNVQRNFKIPKENIYNVGDEVDQYWGGGWKKDPNALHTATQEITETIERMRPWYDAFPMMKLAESNHGTRWKRKALESEIPELMMRRYQSVLGAPDHWLWQKHWKVNCKRPFIVEHGDDWGGQLPHLNASIHNGCSTIIGHFHSLAGIEHATTNGLKVWGVVSGCLIDFQAYAFNYARSAKRKPVLAVTVVLDGGEWPVLVPFT